MGLRIVDEGLSEIRMWGQAGITLKTKQNEKEVFVIYLQME